jgi:hypothetical protein
VLAGEAVTTGNQALHSLMTEIRSLLQRCKLLSRARKTSEQGHDAVNLYGSPRVARHSADRLAQLYASHFESAIRILHLPSFWTAYERYWDDDSGKTASDRIVVELVLAIGTSICQDDLNDTLSTWRSRALQWLHAAHNWLVTASKKERLSIDTLQIQCLLILARQALAIGADLAYVEMGALVGTAIQMGLHRDPRHFKNMKLL